MKKKAAGPWNRASRARTAQGWVNARVRATWYIGVSEREGGTLDQTRWWRLPPFQGLWRHSDGQALRRFLQRLAQTEAH